MEKLEKLEKEEEEKAQRERFEEEQILKAERRKRKEMEEEEMKKKWIEEVRLREVEEERKKEKKRKEEEEAHKEWALRRLALAGYSEESVEKILKGEKQKEKQKEKEKEEKEKEAKGHCHGDKHGSSALVMTRPTYLKVNKKYLATETLDRFTLPWEWDERDDDYIIIKRWIPEYEQELLFEHTRKLRERKLLEYSPAAIMLEKKNGKLQLVEKRARSKSRARSWIFT
ncbi:MAG: hypothetical protein Q9217_007071 [Psora testacea]